MTTALNSAPFPDELKTITNFSKENLELAVIDAAGNGHLDVLRELLKDRAIISEEKHREAIDIAHEKGYSSIEMYLSHIITSEDKSKK